MHVQVAEDKQGRFTAGSAAGIELRNWEGSVPSYPRVIVEARSVDDIVEVLTDPERYPSPVRAHGSNHSTTQCGVADGGTVINMRKMNRIVRIDGETVTAEAGALYIDVAKELERHNLQFYVNIELGNLSLGAAGCTATKDASMPGEYGQVNSYCIGMKIVTPSGELVEITEDEPELLQAARSSFGMFGIVYEVTFKVRTLQAMSLEHRTYELDEFTSALPSLWESGDSMMMYIFPFLDRVSVEFRRYSGDELAARAVNPPRRLAWQVRNFSWGKFVPGIGYLAERYIPSPRVRYRVIDGINRINQVMLNRVITAKHTTPTDQMIRYPDESGWNKYTFSIWAFPEEQYAETLAEYYSWARDYYKTRGWRPNLLHVGYRVLADQSSLFSYTFEGNAMTIDPVSTGAPGWLDFLDAYNDFCSEHGGSPLFNQTRGLNSRHSRAAFGDRIDTFNEFRSRFDPDDRLLNEYFAELLQ